MKIDRYKTRVNLDWEENTLILVRKDSDYIFDANWKSKKEKKHKWLITLNDHVSKDPSFTMNNFHILGVSPKFIKKIKIIWTIIKFIFSK